ncbi:alpha/beta hydrolase [soil metagenome]
MFMTVNDVELFVDIQGQGPPIIAHHGGPGMGSHANDKAAFAPLADIYQIVSFDARGSGRSGAVPPYTHAQWVADLDALREQLGFERFIMTGGSYGGYIALEYTLAHPERVTHLILRDTAASHQYESQAKATALARAAEFPEINEDDLNRIFAGKMKDDNDFKRTFAAIAPLYDANYELEKTKQWLERITFRAQTHNFAFSQNIPGFDLIARLGEITVPTLVIVGRHDWITPLEASQELAAGVPNAELVVFENSGHSPQQEEHERFVAVVRDFLERAKSVPS